MTKVEKILLVRVMSRTEIPQNLLEVAKTIRQIADDLRGDIDVQEFTEYVLTIFFYRFLSEIVTHHLNNYGQRFNPSFDYTKLEDRIARLGELETLREKGFFLFPSLLFGNVLEGFKKDIYFFVPYHIRFYEGSISIQTYIDFTEAIINTEFNITDISLLIDYIFGNIYQDIYYNFQELPIETKEKLEDKTKKLFKCVKAQFPKLGDTTYFYGHKKEQLIQLIDTIKKKNEKLIQIMDAVAKIPLDDFIKQTSNCNIETILEIQENLMEISQQDKTKNT